MCVCSELCSILYIKQNNNVIPMSKTTFLGSTDVEISRIGTGTNRWRKGENDEEITQVYKTLLDNNVTFLDTAEIYTGGRSEQLLGDCIKNDPRPVTVASKYRPNENRKTKKDFTQALDDSLKRLKSESLDLYYVHTPPKSQTINDLMDYMAEAHTAGKIRSIGLSNFDPKQMNIAADRLETHGLPLAANQVEYSLLDRAPEENGVLDACRRLNVSLVAYRPLARGRLTSSAMSATSLAAGDKHMMESKVANVLTEIAHKHDGNVSQVAINWLIHKDKLVIPIPGASNHGHALKNAGSLNWKLSESEFNQIEEAFPK